MTERVPARKGEQGRLGRVYPTQIRHSIAPQFLAREAYRAVRNKHFHHSLFSQVPLTSLVGEPSPGLMPVARYLETPVIRQFNLCLHLA